MRIIGIVLVIMLIGFQYKLWMSDESIPQWIELKKKLASQEELNKKLAAQNHALESDIRELKSGDQSLEEQARFEMGMIKDGEVFYQFVD